MTDKKKIQILQEENARLRKELGHVKYLTSAEIEDYVEDYEKANRELFIELRELRDKYRETSKEVGDLLKEVGKRKGARKGKWKFWRR